MTSELKHLGGRKLLLTKIKNCEKENRKDSENFQTKMLSWEVIPKKEAAIKQNNSHICR